MWSQIKKIWQLLGEYQKVTILTPFLAVLGAGAETIAPLLMAAMIDQGVNTGNLQQIYWYATWSLLFSLLGMGASAWAAICAARAGAGMAKNVRAAMYARIQDFSFRNIDKFSPASLITRMTSDVNSVQNAFSILIRMAVRAPASLFFSLVVAFILNWRLALIFLVLAPVIIIGMYFISTRAHPHFKKLFKIYDRLNLVVEENVRGVRVVKTFVTQRREINKFHTVSDEIYQEFSLAEKILAATSPLMEICTYASIIAIAWFGSHFIIEGTFTTGELISLVNYSMHILMSLMMISMMMVMLVMSRAALERICEVLDEVVDLVNPEHPIKIVPDGRVDFACVGFSYVGDRRRECLQNISLHVPSGQTLEIIGGTGAGKTSLVQLIPRLYDTTQGSVRVGGHDVRDYDLKALRDSVAMVLQKNVLFSGTIRQNLRWGNPHASDQEMITACQQAQIHDFIVSLPAGYDTQVEQGGTNFSGGQRQRLCIARALLKQPKVLILDDSTSAVDTKTEGLIRGAWKTQIPNTTIIIIAQRILSVQQADQILVLDDGQISGLGTHEQLLATNKIYQEVYASQANQEVTS